MRVAVKMTVTEHSCEIFLTCLRLYGLFHRCTSGVTRSRRELATHGMIHLVQLTLHCACDIPPGETHVVRVCPSMNDTKRGALCVRLVQQAVDLLW